MGWAELVDTIAARYGQDPFRVWRDYSLRQIVIMFNLCARSQWRQRAFDAAVHGAEMGQEPRWNFGFNSSIIERAKRELKEYLARKKARKDHARKQTDRH